MRLTCRARRSRAIQEAVELVGHHRAGSIGGQRRLHAKVAKEGDRSDDRSDAIAIRGIQDRAADLDDVSPDPNAVDVGEVAEVAADLSGQISLDVLGAPFLPKRIGVILVGDLELELVDHVPDTGNLFHGAISQHRLIGRGDLA